jgi:hypothetical protein
MRTQLAELILDAILSQLSLLRCFPHRQQSSVRAGRNPDRRSAGQLGHRHLAENLRRDAIEDLRQAFPGAGDPVVPEADHRM